jgi:hypothetical protein
VGFSLGPLRAQPHYSLKKVIAVAAVVFARAQTTTFEICARNHTDTGHCARAFREVPFLRERLGALASLWFLMDTLSGAYCCARKQYCSSNFLFRITILLFEFIDSAQTKLHPTPTVTVQPFVYSSSFGSSEAAGMISASSPSIFRNSAALTKPMFWFGLVIVLLRIQAISSMSFLLARRLSS